MDPNLTLVGGGKVILGRMNRELRDTGDKAQETLGSADLEPIKKRKVDDGDIRVITRPPRLETYDDPRYATVQVHPRRTCRVYFGESLNSKGAAQAFEYCLNQAKMMKGNDTAMDRSVLILSAMACLTPILEGTLGSTMKDLGYSLDIKYMPKDAASGFLGFDPDGNGLDPRLMNCIWGFYALVLFKNVTQASFPEFSKRRKKALAAISGVSEDEFNKYDLFSEYIDADLFSTCFGSERGFKAEVVKIILYHSTKQTPFGRVSGYLKKMLEFTDMGGFLFIVDHILMSSSPLLKLPSLSAEISRFKHAASIVVKSGHPAFFRVLCNPDEYHMLEKSNFPRLQGVAEVLRGRTQPSAKQFTGAALAQREDLTELVGIHDGLLDKTGDFGGKGEYDFLIGKNAQDETI